MAGQQLCQWHPSKIFYLLASTKVQYESQIHIQSVVLALTTSSRWNQKSSKAAFQHGAEVVCGVLGIHCGHASAVSADAPRFGVWSIDSASLTKSEAGQCKAADFVQRRASHRCGTEHFNSSSHGGSKHFREKPRFLPPLIPRQS